MMSRTLTRARDDFHSTMRPARTKDRMMIPRPRSSRSYMLRGGLKLQVPSIGSLVPGALVLAEALLAADSSGGGLLISGSSVTGSIVADSAPFGAKGSWTG